MTKWEYIRLISRHGNEYGANGGVLDLLLWCDKLNTELVTLEEAEEYWNSVCKGGAVQTSPCAQTDGG